MTSENENKPTIPEIPIQDTPQAPSDKIINKTPFFPPDQINNSEIFKKRPKQITNSPKTFPRNELPKNPKPSALSSPSP